MVVTVAALLTMQKTSRFWVAPVMATLLLCWVATMECMNISYDNRALLLDGKRRFLQSGAIHYPRSTAEMWPELINLAKEGGLDMIETYVFWNLHEPEQGTYDFEGHLDLVRFVKDVAAAGLFVTLRIGPYVCAEWNFGGFPSWLRFLPGIALRTDNEVFKIENEHGNIDSAYGSSAKKYLKWAADLGNSLDIGVPWIMCQQWDAPGTIINTCNGYYCDSFEPNEPTKPKFWTENWAGWYQTWGKQVPRRPVEDIAFAVARFFQRGGSMQNYYMYHGGTNFGRSTGEWITTTYDYDAPLDEYGQPRQPKWGHLKELHAAIKLCEPALAIVDGTPFRISLGPATEAHIYANGNGDTVEEIVSRSTICVAFLANIDSRADRSSVLFNGNTYELPAWSVSILPDCENVIFNTAKVKTQTNVMKMVPATEDHIISQLQAETGVTKRQFSLQWVGYSEPEPGTWGKTFSFSGGLLEQINITKDLSDYLWYIISVQVPNVTDWTVSIQGMTDTVHVFLNGDYAGSPNLTFEADFTTPLNVKEGNNSIAILSGTVGLQNYGPWLEREAAGIEHVELAGPANTVVNLTNEEWQYQVGVKGESLKLFTAEGAEAVTWQQSSFPNQSLVWYKTTFDAPAGLDPVALDLGSMGKGQAWINGKSIGRFWTLPRTNLINPRLPCSTECSYRGGYNPDNCASSCGEASQRWYHLPRGWLRPSDNLLVIFEESGGDVSKVAVVTQVLDRVCAHVDLPDLHPARAMPSAPRQSYITNNISSQSNAITAREKQVAKQQLHLTCAPGGYISEVLFGSIGNPSGECGSFQRGSCHADLRAGPLRQECIGRQQCSLEVSLKTYAVEDPCPALLKSLAVEILCTATEVTSPSAGYSAM